MAEEEPGNVHAEDSEEQQDQSEIGERPAKRACLSSRSRGLFTWADVAISSLSREDVLTSLLGQRCLYTSTCSGLGAAEAAGASIREALRRLLGSDMKSFRCTGAFEMDSSCYPFLRAMTNGHIWGNLFHSFPCKLLPQAMVSKDPLERVRLFEEAFQRDLKLPCMQHCSSCAVNRAHGDVSGTPCPPWSQFGSQTGRSESVCLTCSSQELFLENLYVCFINVYF